VGVWKSVHGEQSVKAQAVTPLESVTFEEKGEEKFNWYKHWWPVQFVYNLDDDRPNRVELMGEFFAVWKSPNGKWVAMRDMCPHRMAPLSEGRIEEDGTLMCSYHGWRFNDCGKCVKIPQADDASAHETACNNPRSAAKMFPCKVSGTVLWIWPDASESAFAEAESTSTGVPDAYTEYLEEQMAKGDTTEFFSEFPYDYEILMENLVDPSHVPFSHHGTPGAKRSDAVPLNMKPVDASWPSSRDAVVYSDARNPRARIEVLDNRFISYETESSDPDRSNFVFFNLASPIRDGRSRVFFFRFFPGALSGNLKIPFPLKVLMDKLPWFLHLGNMNFVCGDHVFLHIQDNHLREFNGWHQGLYFTPTSADVMVTKIRSWYSKHAGGGPFADTRNGTKLKPMSRRELLDRYDSHVSQCKVCQKGLRFVNRLSLAFKLISRTALFIGCAMAVNLLQHGSVRIWMAAATAIFCAVFSFFEHFINEKIIPCFYYVNYVHADKN